jgi:hypothetical protein
VQQRWYGHEHEWVTDPMNLNMTAVSVNDDEEMPTKGKINSQIAPNDAIIDTVNTI